MTYYFSENPKAETDSQSTDPISLHWELYHKMPKAKPRVLKNLMSEDGTADTVLSMKLISTIKSGASFGEEALHQSKKPKKTSKRAVTVTDCHLAWLSKDDFTRCVKYFSLRQQENLTYFIRSLPFFTELSRDKALKFI